MDGFFTNRDKDQQSKVLDAIEQLAMQQGAEFQAIADRLKVLESQDRRVSNDEKAAPTHAAKEDDVRGFRAISALDHTDKGVADRRNFMDTLLLQLHHSEQQHAAKGNKRALPPSVDRMLDRQLRKLPSIHPDGIRRFRWLCFKLAVLLLGSVYPSLRLGFAHQFAEHDLLWTLLELAIDLVLMVDIGLSFVTAFYAEGRTSLEAEQRKVAHHYLTTNFIFDLVAAFPFCIIIYALGDDAAWLRLTRVLRVAHFYRATGRFHSHKLGQRYVRSFSSEMVVLIELLLVVALVWHWVGCIWAFNITTEGGLKFDPYEQDTHDTAIADDGTELPGYVPAIHWAITVTTGLGAPFRAQSNRQALMEAGTVVVGVAAESLIFGAVSSVVDDIDREGKKRQQKLDTVKQYVRAKRVPLFVRERVVDFYEHDLAKMRPQEEAQLLKELPNSLRIDLAVVINQPLLRKFKMFREVDPGAIGLLALLMVQRPHMPDENVIVEGENNSSLYIVQSGELRVYVKAVTAPEKTSPQTRRRRSICALAFQAPLCDVAAPQDGSSFPPRRNSRFGTMRRRSGSCGSSPEEPLGGGAQTPGGMPAGSPDSSPEMHRPPVAEARDAASTLGDVKTRSDNVIRDRTATSPAIMPSRPPPPSATLSKTNLCTASTSSSAALAVPNPSGPAAASGPSTPTDPAVDSFIRPRRHHSERPHARTVMTESFCEPLKCGEGGRSLPPAVSEVQAIGSGSVDALRPPQGCLSGLVSGPTPPSPTPSRPSSNSTNSAGRARSRSRSRSRNQFYGDKAYGPDAADPSPGEPSRSPSPERTRTMSEPPSKQLEKRPHEEAAEVPPPSYPTSPEPQRGSPGSPPGSFSAGSRDPARAVPLAPVPAIESEIKKADPKDFVSEVAKLGRLVAKLTEGDAFGEQSFVMKTPSLASVRTMSYCDLLTLTSGDLEYVFTSYPSLKLKLHAYAIEQRAKYDSTNAGTKPRGAAGTGGWLSRPVRRRSATAITDMPFARDSKGEEGRIPRRNTWADDGPRISANALGGVRRVSRSIFYSESGRTSADQYGKPRPSLTAFFRRPSSHQAAGQDSEPSTSAPRLHGPNSIHLEKTKTDEKLMSDPHDLERRYSM